MVWPTYWCSSYPRDAVDSNASATPGGVEKDTVVQIEPAGDHVLAWCCAVLEFPVEKKKLEKSKTP